MQVRKQCKLASCPFLFAFQKLFLHHLWSCCKYLRGNKYYLQTFVTDMTTHGRRHEELSPCGPIPRYGCLLLSLVTVWSAAVRAAPPISALHISGVSRDAALLPSERRAEKQILVVSLLQYMNILPHSQKRDKLALQLLCIRPEQHNKSTMLCQVRECELWCLVQVFLSSCWYNV